MEGFCSKFIRSHQNVLIGDLTRTSPWTVHTLVHTSLGLDLDYANSDTQQNLSASCKQPPNWSSWLILLPRHSSPYDWQRPLSKHKSDYVTFFSTAPQCLQDITQPDTCTGHRRTRPLASAHRLCSLSSSLSREPTFPPRPCASLKEPCSWLPQGPCTCISFCFQL